MIVKPADFNSPQLRELLAAHLSGMQAHSPPESVYALDFSSLQQPEISFWEVVENDALLGFGALKQLADEHGEIKSMRTHAAHQRRGVARFLLNHIVATAKSRGYRRLSLETGSGDAFNPALRLYQEFGFQPCGPFSDYQQSDFNQFLSLNLIDAERD